MKSFYILDGHYQIYRAFYGLGRPLHSPAGEPTAAVHVFCAMLFALLSDRKPDYVAMAMDVSDETVFRRDIDPDYKANRDPMPEELQVQAERIVAIVQALGIPILRVPGFEADDVMATLAERLKDDDVHLFLASKDKDLEQLLSDRVSLYDSRSDKVIDPAVLMEEKGYAPQQSVEVQTLAGDTTDNVAGVPGIGVKTAAKLVNKYGSAAAVVEHADELTPKMRANVKGFADKIAMTRELVTLRRDVPFQFDLAECATGRIEVDGVRAIFSELGFNRLMEPLDALAGEPGAGGRSVPGVVFADTGAPAPAASMDGAEYELIDTPSALEKFVTKLGRQRTFAFDTETTGLNPVHASLAGLSFCWKAGEAYYIPVRAAIGKALPVKSVVAKLGPILEDPSATKVGHNLKYDVVAVRQEGIRVAGAAFDTMLASFLLDPLRNSHSLDSLAKTLLGHEMIPITDLIGKGKEQITIDQVPTSRVCEYAAEDADFTWRLWEHFEPRIAGSHVERLFRETEVPLVFVLAEMEHNGIALDAKLLAKLGVQMGDRLHDLTRDVHKAAGHEFNIDSTKQLANVLFDELALPVVRKTKTGRSTDADTLAALAAQTEHPIPKLVLEYRELAKLKGTYVETLPKMICRRTGRVHANFNQTGAVTGRLSSSDPNLQNIPVRTEVGKQIRAAVVTGRAGSALLTADYSQIELRLLAHFCEDDNLIEAFRSGQDIHRSVAAQVNGVRLENVTPAQRSAAKAVNFGIIYGQSAFGLSRSLGIPVGDAKDFIDAYFGRYRGIQRFIKACVADARKKGYAETILGRRRPVPQLTSRNRQQAALGERIAVNTVVQGSAADLIKRAMIEIHEELAAGRCKAAMLIQVHDELVFEVPQGEVEREAEMIRAKMEGAMKLRVPIVVDVACGKNWAERTPIPRST